MGYVPVGEMKLPKVVRGIMAARRTRIANLAPMTLLSQVEVHDATIVDEKASGKSGYALSGIRRKRGLAFGDLADCLIARQELFKAAVEPGIESVNTPPPDCVGWDREHIMSLEPIAVAEAAVSITPGASS